MQNSSRDSKPQVTNGARLRSHSGRLEMDMNMNGIGYGLVCHVRNRGLLRKTHVLAHACDARPSIDVAIGSA